MKNPLADFFPIKETSDGVFVTITPETAKSCPLQNVIAALDGALVTNYDTEALCTAFTRARGEPDRIGPPFEYYNPLMDRYIDVSITDEKADMRILSSISENELKCTPTSIIYCLRRKGIVFGIDAAVIEQAIQKHRYDTNITVACSRLPIDGEDARIELYVNIEKDTKPQVRTDGSVDFREIQSFSQISQGQVLARKIPATSGVPGTTVTGKSIDPKPGKDVELQAGNNVLVSKDGCELIAEKSGVVKKEGHLIAVSEILTIDGDVDFSVGNVKYSGDLIISGGVKPGFTVETDGDITIKGSVESARIISRKGHVTIVQGVIGKGETHIEAKAGIHVHFAQEALIRTEGALVVNKHLLHCDARCNTFEMPGRDPGVVGGHVAAYSWMQVANCGNEYGIETRLAIVDREREKNETSLIELEKAYREMVEKFEPVKKQVQAKAAIFKKAGVIMNDRVKAEMKKWVDAYNSGNQKLKYVEQKITELKQLLAQESTGDGYIRVARDIYPGTVLSLYGSMKLIRERSTGKVFRNNQGLINDGPVA